MNLPHTSFERYEELVARGLISVDQVIASNPECVMFATLHRRPRMVEYFLNHGASPSPRNDCGFTPLHETAKNGDLEIAKLLLLASADVDAVDDDARATALHLAASAGNNDVVLALLRAGANVNLQAVRGETPLYMAAFNGRLVAVRMLLHHNANPKFVGDDNHVALEVAVKNGHSEVVEEFREKLGFEVCGGETKGNFSLKIAVELQCGEILRSLTLGGVKDTGGHALCRAVSRADEESLKILLGASGNPRNYLNQARSRSRRSLSVLECCIPTLSRYSNRMVRIVRRLLDAGMGIRDVDGEHIVRFLQRRIKDMERYDFHCEGAQLVQQGILHLFLREPAIHALSWGWDKKGTTTTTTTTTTSITKVRLRRATKKERSAILLAAVSREKVDEAFRGVAAEPS